MPSDGDFLLVVSGLTRNAPCLKDWQMFKDHLRQVVREQPGWADVYPSQGKRAGEMQGWCRLKHREDADSVYESFIKERKICVHIWETCRSSGGFRLMKCNCSAQYSGLPDGGHSPGQSGIDITRVNQLGGKAYAALTTPYTTSQPRYPYGMYPQPQAYTVAPSYPVQTTPAPVYSTSTNGMPVNVRGGAVLTEARGIFIRNLSYKVTPDQLNSLLQTVGHPVESRLLTDPRTGGFKGVATAKFASKEAAQYAAYYLNAREHMGMTLHVRLDTDTTIVGKAEPMVVNGSHTYRY